MKKKSLIFSRCVLYALLLSFSLQAQVIVNLQQAPPNQWHVEDMWQLNLTNPANEDLEVYLYATIEEEDAGIIFEATSASFTMEANYSGPVNRVDLEPVDVEYHDGDYEDIFQRTGTLPAGNYTICVYVKSVDGENMGNDCIMQIIAHPSPPELINPFDEANVTEELPVFLWLPPMPIGDFVTYNIKIVELLDGQVPIEAMEANPAWFEETEVFSTSFQYPISAREFEQGITYAWKVTATSGDGLVIGESPVWSFNYEAAVVVIHEEPVSIELISPVNGEEIIDPELLFEWMPIDTALVTLAVTPEVSYNLIIWQLLEDLAERVAEGYKFTEADIDDFEPYYLKDEILGTSLTGDARDFEPGFTYGWQVTAWSGEWGIGRSEVNTFYLKTQKIGEIVLDYFIPDTLFSGAKTEATLVGKGFIEGMDFEVPYDGIDVTDAQFQDSEHYLIDFKIASDVSPGHYIFQVKTVSGEAKQPATALNVTEKDCDSILKINKTLQDKISKKVKECEELQKKVNELQAERNVAQKERDAKKKNRDDAKRDLGKAKGEMEKLIDNTIFSNEVTRKEPSEKDQKNWNWIGLCGGEVKIWFTGSDASIDVLLLWLSKSYAARQALEKEYRDADKKLTEAEKALAKAENKLNEINQKLRNAKDALDKCRQEKGEMEKELKKLEEKHKQCLNRLGEQNESQGSINKAKGELAIAEAQIKAAEKKIKEVERKLKPECKTAENLLKKAKELLKQAKEKAKKAEAAIMRAEEQLKKGCLKNAKKHLEELKPKDTMEDIKALSGSAIDKAIEAEADNNKWEADRKKKEEERKREEEEKHLENLLKRTEDGSKKALYQLLSELGLIAISETSKSTGHIISIIKAVLVLKDMPDCVCKILRSLWLLMIPNNLSGTTDVFAANYLQAWKDCAGIPSISSLPSGWEKLADMVNNIPTEQEQQQKICDAIKIILERKCKRR